jgi:putative addiction module component (TIGR02574 family)
MVGIPAGMVFHSVYPHPHLVRKSAGVRNAWNAPAAVRYDACGGRPMSDAANTLLQQAMNLNPDERYELAQLLLDSLEEDDGLPDDPEWRAELDRRIQSVADGTAVLIDGEEVFRRVKERLEKRRNG